MHGVVEEPSTPQLADVSRWYTEHTALFLSTLKWALLGACAGFCVGWGTRAFLWSLPASSSLAARLLPGNVRPYFTVTLGVWLAGIAGKYGRDNVLIDWTEQMKADVRLRDAVSSVFGEPGGRDSAP